MQKDQEEIMDGTVIYQAQDSRKSDLVEQYAMNHPRRGLFVIFNNKNFDSRNELHTRTGSDKDAERLQQCFEKLGFIVETYTDLKADAMLKKLCMIVEERSFADCDCIAVALLSHGVKGAVYGTDWVIVTFEQLAKPLRTCATLAGKPKLFFIQACQGNDVDPGVVVHDADPDDRPGHTIPCEADFLFACSTLPGYVSWRDHVQGSLYVQTLCDKLEAYGAENDILWVLTRVNQDVSKHEIMEKGNRMKQMPSITSILRKDLILKPKDGGT